MAYECPAIMHSSASMLQIFRHVDPSPQLVTPWQGTETSFDALTEGIAAACHVLMERRFVVTVLELGVKPEKLLHHHPVEVRETSLGAESAGDEFLFRQIGGLEATREVGPLLELVREQVPRPVAPGIQNLVSPLAGEEDLAVFTAGQRVDQGEAAAGAIL